MKLPILVEFKPILDGYGPKVYIPEGRWEIICNNKDSKISIETESSTYPLEEFSVIPGNTTAKARFVHKGTEGSITLYLIKL
jgi:hypothetical protein